MAEQQFDTKILVVDDSAFMRQMIIGFLNEYGFSDICEAGNGKLAVEKYDKMQPNVVLLDLIMPIETGPETLDQLVSRGANVIVISAMGQENMIEEMLKKGAKGYFIKPFFSTKEVGDKIIEITTSQ